MFGNNQRHIPIRDTNRTQGDHNHDAAPANVATSSSVIITSANNGTVEYEATFVRFDGNGEPEIISFSSNGNNAPDIIDVDAVVSDIDVNATVSDAHEDAYDTACNSAIEEPQARETFTGRIRGWFDFLHRAYFNKRAVASFLYLASRFFSYVSWVMFAMFLCGRFVNQDIIVQVGIVGSLVVVSLFVILDEVSRKMLHRGRGVIGILIIAAAVALVSCGLYGITIDDFEYISGGVLGLFALTFVPWVTDSVVASREEAKHYHYAPSSRGGYNIVGDVFGIPQPQDPPPIEVSRDDDLDDEWRKHLTQGILIDVPSQIELGTVAEHVTSTRSKHVKQESINTDYNDNDATELVDDYGFANSDYEIR